MDFIDIAIAKGSVRANPTLAGTESNLTGLQVGNTKYKVPQGGSGGGAVDSVNGQTGAVVLDATDVGAVAQETGKGLSTNDYTTTDKNNVTANTNARHTHANKSALDDIDGTTTATTLDIDTTVTASSNNLVTSGAVATALAGKQNAASSQVVTIAVADWNSGTTCTKNVTGVTATNIVICDASDSSVQCTAQGNGILTFTATATPTASVVVKVVIL